VTNLRLAAFHGLPVAPASRSTTPVPLRKAQVRHGRQWEWPHADGAVGFAEIVVSEIERNRSFKVFKLLAEGVREPG